MNENLNAIYYKSDLIFAMCRLSKERAIDAITRKQSASLQNIKYELYVSSLDKQ